MKVEEIKSYKCSDGEVFIIKAEAEKHEEELNNPEYKTEKRIKELESRILALEVENATLSARIAALEAKNMYRWPTPKLPGQPGDVVYDAAQISKMSDEELKEKGYSVVYCGDKRAVC